MESFCREQRQAPGPTRLKTGMEWRAFLTLKGRTYDSEREIFGEFDRLAESFRQANVDYNMLVLVDDPAQAQADDHAKARVTGDKKRAEHSGGSSRRW